MNSRFFACIAALVLVPCCVENAFCGLSQMVDGNYETTCQRVSPSGDVTIVTVQQVFYADSGNMFHGVSTFEDGSTALFSGAVGHSLSSIHPLHFYPQDGNKGHGEYWSDYDAFQLFSTYGKYSVYCLGFRK